MPKPPNVNTFLTDPALLARFAAFLADDTTDLYSPTGLSAAGRKAWHMLAEQHGLHSVSLGEGFHRIVRASKTPITSKTSKTTQLNTTGMRRFREDFNLKLNLADVSDFDYFIDLYDTHYDARAKLAMMEQAMDELGGESAWKDYQEVPKQKLWAAIQSQPAWPTYVADDMSRFADARETHLTHPNLRVHRRDPYDLAHHGRLFASFDLRSATFNSLRHYDPSLTLHTATWTDLLDRFVDVKSRYFHTSKTFRLKVFWQLHQPKLMTIAAALITRVIPALHAAIPDLLPQTVLYWNQDEVAFLLSPQNPALTATQIHEAHRAFHTNPAIGPDLAPHIKLELFRLRVLSAPKRYFVKERLDHHAPQSLTFHPLPHFVRVPPAHFAAAYKHYFNLPLDPRALKLAWDADAHQFTTTDPQELAFDPDVVSLPPSHALDPGPTLP